MQHTLKHHLKTTFTIIYSGRTSSENNYWNFPGQKRPDWISQKTDA